MNLWSCRWKAAMPPTYTKRALAMGGVKIKLLIERLQLEETPIVLEGGYLLREAYRTEINALRECVSKINFPLAFNTSYFKVVEKQTCYAGYAWNKLQNEANKAKKIITALRLFKSGPVTARMVLFEADPSPSLLQMFDLYNVAFSEGEECLKLGRTEIEKFQSFWAWIRRFLYQDMKSMGAIGIALRRFELSYSRRSLTDKLLDLVIALEALFGEYPELRFRIAQRAALLLFADADEETKIKCRNTIQTLYDKRSGIVHGSFPEVTVEDIKKLKDYVRRGITLVVELWRKSTYGNIKEFHRALLKQLDEIVFSAQPSLENFLNRIH